MFHLGMSLSPLLGSALLCTAMKTLWTDRNRVRRTDGQTDGRSLSRSTFECIFSGLISVQIKYPATPLAKVQGARDALQRTSIEYVSPCMHVDAMPAPVTVPTNAIGGLLLLRRSTLKFVGA